MIMTFIARGMRSKKITRIEHKLALNLKHTQSKIWNELNKEINYLRRVFNELQLSKVKRVYVDECECEIPATKFPRSNSFPDVRSLAFGRPEQDIVGFQKPRRRANSEVVPLEDQVVRVVSETDLQRIDKTATFAAHAIVQPAELLARLVNILGYMPPGDDFPESEAGYDKSQELDQKQETGKEEKTEDRTKWFDSWKHSDNKELSSWRIGSERIVPKPRSRAASEIRLYDRKSEANGQTRNVDWTWSGPAASRKLRELMKARVNESSDYPAAAETKNTKESKTSVFRPFAIAKSVPKALLPRLKKPFTREKSTVSEAAPGKDALEKEDIGGNAAFVGQLPLYPDETRTSSSRRHYYTHTGANPVNFTEGSNLLEETSVADFLRALTVLHASVGAVPDEYTGKPRRKMGTACLTPPKLPSLFTLFSSPPPNVATQLEQGVSVESAPDPSSPSTPSPARAKTSIAFISKPRRFSLRPVATPVGPPTPPGSGSPSLSNLARETNARLRNTSLSESPTLPLIEMEGAPGRSSPASEVRRLSLRPAQQVGGPLGMPVGSKALPRWKAGMLQRQIGQMNLRRRSRAFSLSDAYSNEHSDDKNPALQPSPFDVQSTFTKLVKNAPRDPNVFSIRFEDAVGPRDSAASTSERRLSDYKAESSLAGSRENAEDSSPSLRLAEKRKAPLDRYEPLLEVKVEKPVTNRGKSEDPKIGSHGESKRQV